VHPVLADPVAAFDAWAADQGAEVTAIAVLRADGTLTGDSLDIPFDLASNSKAITALCIHALVAEGVLDWDTPLSEALAEPAPETTVAELVTHTSGIAPDGTQWRMGLWLNETEPRHARVTRIVLDRRSQRGTRGDFQYNNENYALLGRIIELATGAPYQDACRARVLDPAGVSGGLSPRFAGFAGWGGWRMTMGDHARLIGHWFGPQGAVGRDPLAQPHVARSDSSYYGLGMNYRGQAPEWRLSHAGAISIPFGPKTGAFVVRFADGTVVATAYDVAVAQPDQFRALERALQEALSSAGAE
jgi:CubicO group peptidase (beta-lactamase class C family)